MREGSHVELLELLPHHRNRRPVVLHASLHEHERRPLHDLFVRRDERLATRRCSRSPTRPPAEGRSSRPPSPDADAPSPVRRPSPSGRSASSSRLRAVDRAAAHELVAHRLHRMAVDAHPHGVIVEKHEFVVRRSAPDRAASPSPARAAGRRRTRAVLPTPRAADPAPTPRTRPPARTPAPRRDPASRGARRRRST